MNPKLNLQSYQRKELVDAILFIKETYFNRIAPVFKHVEKEADAVQEDYYINLGKHFHPDYHDPGDFAEEAFFKGLDYYESTNLMQYNTRLSWVTMLYQYWEQQLRKFLFKELTRFHSYTLRNGNTMTFKDFCPTGRITEFEKIFIDLQFNVKEMSCWASINEMRVLNNVIKHSEGNSAHELRKLRPDYFTNQYFGGDSLERNLSTLNDITLNVSDQDLIIYADAIVSFWSELPEHIPVINSVGDIFEF